MSVYNFCAGPATMPKAVLEQAQNELLDFQGLGVSVMEMSHRSPEFVAIAERAEQALRQLLGVSDEYAVLFLQGGATAQFAGVPLNLLKTAGDYVVTGAWSKKAYQTACAYHSFGRVSLAAQGDGKSLPKVTDWRINADADYLHYCSNETIHGVQFDAPPNIDVPLVVDMSSDILSRPIDVNRFAMIYAGAQKNIGPAGLTVVIVHQSLLGTAHQHCSSVLDYTLQAKNNSMLNTPPTFSWYLAGLVFEWLLGQGGLAAIEKQNQAKANLLYQVIDNSELYYNNVDKACRSLMNVPFLLGDGNDDNSDNSALTSLFLQQAEENGLLNLKGHRSVGGVRASLYNAMPLAGVVALTEFMQAFERRYG